MTETFTEQETAQIINDKILFPGEPVNPALKICVILPVRNEEDNIIAALDALRLQKDCCDRPLSKESYEVLLLANNCTDRSVEFAHAYQKRYPDFRLYIQEITLPFTVAHIGTVRRMLMDAAYERLTTIGNPGGIIASTDSDSEVDPCWLYQTVTEIEKGIDVVGGRILTKPEKSTSRLYYLRDITYKYLVSRLEDLLDPVAHDRWPRHFQCFGASFAVTCQIYDLSGRLPVVPFLEDMAFHKSLVRVDAKIRLSPLVQVSTSSRIQGRVDFGLSIQLKQWGEMNMANHAMMVEPAGSLISKLSARRLLRNAWKKKDFSPVSRDLMDAATILDLDVEWLKTEIVSYPYFGMFWEQVEQRILQKGWLCAWPPQDVRIVIPALKAEILHVIRNTRTDRLALLK